MLPHTCFLSYSGRCLSGRDYAFEQDGMPGIRRRAKLKIFASDLETCF